MFRQSLNPSLRILDKDHGASTHNNPSRSFIVNPHAVYCRTTDVVRMKELIDGICLDRIRIECHLNPHADMKRSDLK